MGKAFLECDVLGVGVLGEEVSLIASSQLPTTRVDLVPKDHYKGRSHRESCRDFSQDKVGANLAQDLDQLAASI